MAYDLDRFVKAQESDYERALEEMKCGKKTSHWIWYIFPQLKGLGRSYNAEFYGIENREEAELYLNDPLLGGRLREICCVVKEHSGMNIYGIMGGGIDAAKLKSSMTLFDVIEPDGVFKDILTCFFEGKRDNRTLEMLGE